MAGQLTLYYRLDCGLCEDFLRELQQQLGGRNCSLQQVDVDTDPELTRRYGSRVPVLVGSGRELCHYELDRVALDNYLSTGQNPLKCPPV